MDFSIHKTPSENFLCSCLEEKEKQNQTLYSLSSNPKLETIETGEGD